MLLTHYYHQDDQPFQNLSALTDEAAVQVIAGLRDRSGAVYLRFADPEKYWQQRRTTEKWLKQEFIKKGGQPVLDYPHYLVVERAVWIEEGYHGNSDQVQRLLADFPPSQVSFTYPDSMISYWLQSQTDEAFYHSEYHGQVFTVGEIQSVINQFGIPQTEWRTTVSRRYDLFIEAQVWTDIL
jgi:hypothetical protein